MKYLLLGLLFILTGCSTLEQCGLSTPSPASSEYLRTEGGGFTFTAGRIDLGAQYHLILSIIKPVAEGTLLEAHFQNPIGRDDIVLTKILNTSDTSIDLQTENLHGFKSYEGYKVVIYLYSNSSRTTLIGKHIQYIQSIVRVP